MARNFSSSRFGRYGLIDVTGLRSGPTGDDEATYQTFLEALTRAVVVHRRARALKYRLRRLERLQKWAASDLDEARLSHRQAHIRFPKGPRRDHLKDDSAEIEVLGPAFEVKYDAYEELKEQYSKISEELGAVAERVYVLEASVSNDELRPNDELPLPPRLFSMLRLSREGSFLLADDKARVQKAENDVQRSLSQLEGATIRIQEYIERVESSGLAEPDFWSRAMAELRRRIDNHSMMVLYKKRLEAKASRREFHQRFYEAEIFLDVAGPVLEGYDRIEVDSLRTSIVDLDENGERFIYQNIPSHRLTDNQSEDFQSALDAWREDYRDALDAEAHVREARSEAFRAFWTANPDSEEGPFDERNDEDRLVVEEMKIEAIDEATHMLHLVRDANVIDRHHDLVDEDTDGRTGSLSPEAREIKRRDFNADVVDDWRGKVGRRSTAAQLTDALWRTWDNWNRTLGRGSLNSWAWRSIHIDEERCWDGPLNRVPREERWIRGKLLPRDEKAMEEMRLGMPVFRRSTRARAMGRCCRWWRRRWWRCRQKFGQRC